MLAAAACRQACSDCREMPSNPRSWHHSTAASQQKPQLPGGLPTLVSRQTHLPSGCWKGHAGCHASRRCCLLHGRHRVQLAGRHTLQPPGSHICRQGVIMTAGRPQQSASTRVATSCVVQAGAAAGRTGVIEADWLRVTVCRQQSTRSKFVPQVLMCLAGGSAHISGTRPTVRRGCCLQQGNSMTAWLQGAASRHLCCQARYF